MTRTPLEVAKEIVQGLQSDLVPTERTLWARMSHTPTELNRTIAMALADEDSEWPSAERLMRIEAMTRESIERAA